MEKKQNKIRLAAAGAVLAGLFGLAVWSGPRVGTALLTQPELFSFLVYLETGRVLRIPGPAEVPETEPAATAAPETTPEEKPATPPPTVLTAAELDNISMLYRCDYRPELVPLLTQPLRWDLADGEPSVLIIHTHGSECYTPAAGEDFSMHEPYRTLDDDHNMISIGRELARLLEAGGIRVLHDTRCHDDPDYNRSYSSARASIQDYLRQYPLHPDGAGPAPGCLRRHKRTAGHRCHGGRPALGPAASHGGDGRGWQSPPQLAGKSGPRAETYCPA